MNVWKPPTAKTDRMPTMISTVTNSIIVKPDIAEWRDWMMVRALMRAFMASPLCRWRFGAVARELQVAIGYLRPLGRRGYREARRRCGRADRDLIELAHLARHADVERSRESAVVRDRDVLTRIEQVLFLAIGDVHHESLRRGAVALRREISVARVRDRREDGNDDDGDHELDEGHTRDS